MEGIALGEAVGRPDDNDVNILMSCLDTWQAESMDQVDMKVQLFAELHIETLVAGIAADERSEKGALEADLVPLDGLKDVGRDVLYRVAACVATMQLIKSVTGERSRENLVSQNSNAWDCSCYKLSGFQAYRVVTLQAFEDCSWGFTPSGQIISTPSSLREQQSCAGTLVSELGSGEPTFPSGSEPLLRPRLSRLHC